MATQEERRSNFASTAAAAPQGGDRVMEERPPQHSMEPDTIDLLDQPTKCILVVDVMGCRMEDGKGLVYPGVEFIDEVRIGVLYAVVKVDMVHEFAKQFKLEVPPDDTTQTL